MSQGSTAEVASGSHQVAEEAADENEVAEVASGNHQMAEATADENIDDRLWTTVEIVDENRTAQAFTLEHMLQYIGEPTFQTGLRDGKIDVLCMRGDVKMYYFT